MKPIFFFPLVIALLLAFSGIYYYVVRPWQKTSEKIVDGFVPGANSRDQQAVEARPGE